MSIKAHMICHTHWDREWYLTREEFRTKLVRLIDGLLEMMEMVPEYVSFMLDGQTIAIEDYLEIKPYNREKLFAALKAGKIICGPWYILPDELLISGESHIRNYMKGTEIVKEAGNKMETAYLPDSFGHPAQMPQIVEGLGMNTMVFWRGVSNQVKKTEFYWESPFTDAKVLCVHMPHGYGNCGNLSEDMEVTVPRVQALVESLGAKSATDIILLMNGSDHIIGQKNINRIVKKLNQELKDCQIELSTMEAYLRDLKEHLGALPSFRGEFCSGERSMLLGGTLSARMYLKQRNDQIQNRVERYLEPVLAVEKLCGRVYDSKGYLNYLWKRILENQPHDSICGCSVDAVHREMMIRYAAVQQLEDTLLSDAIVRNSEKEKKQRERQIKIFLFEPTLRSGASSVDVEIYMDRMLVQEVDFTKSVIVDYEEQMEHPEIPSGLHITDEKGREIPYVILKAEKSYDTLYQDHTSPEIYKANKMLVRLLLPEFSYGCHQLFVEPAERSCLKQMKTEGRMIENAFYQLKAEKSNIVLFDKRRGREYKRFVRLLDGGDAGDTYTYSWPEKDREYEIDWGEFQVEKEVCEGISQSLTLYGNFMLPAELSPGRKDRSELLKACPVSVKFILYEGIERIDCCMEFDNRVKDHRLQIQFPSGVKTDTSEAYDIFYIASHPVEVAVPDEWMEYPQSTHPTHGYIEVHDQKNGMSIGTKGLPEYEAVQLETETAVNLTLLRCVGWLSRTDLLTRHGNGGWTIETPEAQCLGKHTFEFSVTYHENKRERAFDLIEQFRYPVYLKQVWGDINGLVSGTQEDMFAELPEGVQLSCVKPSEDQQGIVIRLYSICEEKRRFSMRMPEIIKEVWLTNLAEVPQKAVSVQSGGATVSICPNQVLTLLLKW